VGFHGLREEKIGSKIWKKKESLLRFLPLLSSPFFPYCVARRHHLNTAVNRCYQPPPLTHPLTDNKGSRRELLPSLPQVFSQKLMLALVDGISIHNSTISRQQNQSATPYMLGNSLFSTLPSSTPACRTIIHSLCREQIIINMVDVSSQQPCWHGMDLLQPSPNK